MTNSITTLESCWYISPPWGQQIPPMVISLLERVYLPGRKVFGYCCGVEWSDGWEYSIALDHDIVSVRGMEIITSGRLQAVSVEKPVFMVGELVKFQFAGDGPKIRTVLGLQLINGAWFYQIEWKSPYLIVPEDAPICILPQSSSNPKLNSRLAWVTDYDLVGV
ncbi:DUF1392 family protein [Nostoc sp. TCL26-01]|uniref:DUF1392 family protein n=1 Tax=Nostoc sp. TCL26-01 TaxID=2576904 RepID=UPI0015B7D0B9|nr:DUF1392 family protein [Nostoc sp. TCL26-01]QLE59617.1 DUF1392 domain-containing protein [Nostoc sp. TCL26-01]